MATKNVPAQKEKSGTAAVKKAAAKPAAKKRAAALPVRDDAGRYAGTVPVPGPERATEITVFSSLFGKGGKKIPISTLTQLIDGEFRGDFTRDTFMPGNHYSRVLMQQGRVQLDADWNEQASILLHYLQALAADLIGPFGGPVGHCGFEIKPYENDFRIGAGRFYINGVLCENDEEISYRGQVTPPLSIQQASGNQKMKYYLVYLDAWERTVSGIEDECILETALGGPDTAVRSKIEWMVRISDRLLGSASGEIPCMKIRKDFDDKYRQIPSFLGRMRPVMNSGDQSDDICTIHPDTKYRGVENQLYRVEIHTGGIAGNATFKWSRANGNVQFPIVAMKEYTITLGNLGRDASLSIRPGNFVEIVDDNSILQGYTADDIKDTMWGGNTLIGNRRKLYEVESVDRSHLTVTLKKDAGLPDCGLMTSHPLLRRYDHVNPDADDNCRKILESTANSMDYYYDLEDGIRIQFIKAEKINGENTNDENTKTVYLPGDYWLLPARVNTGEIDWPAITTGITGEYVPLPPHGTIHGYAPLAIISADPKGTVALVNDCRCKFSINLSS